MELTVSNGIYCTSHSPNGLPGPALCWELLWATVLLHPEFESLLPLHELGVGLVNTLTVTLEKLSEIVVLSGMSSLCAQQANNT